MNHKKCTKASGAGVSLAELADPAGSGLTCENEILTSSEIIVNNGNNYGDKITGYFKAPVDGVYTFYASGDDNFKVSMNRGTTALDSKDPAGAEEIISLNRHTSFRDYSTFNTYSTPVTLVKDQYYYLEALHIEGGGDDHFTLSVRFNNPAVTNHHNSIKEVQRLQIIQNNAKENTTITFEGYSSDVVYKLTFKDPASGATLQTDEIPIDASASTFNDRVDDFYRKYYGSVIVVTRTMWDVDGIETTTFADSTK